jgi:hypothetical protein
VPAWERLIRLDRKQGRPQFRRAVSRRQQIATLTSWSPRIRADLSTHPISLRKQRGRHQQRSGTGEKHSTTGQLICEYGPVVHPGSNVEWGEVYIASKIREVDDPASADRASDLTLDFPILVDRSVFLSVEWQIFPMKFELAAAQRADAQQNFDRCTKYSARGVL